MSNPIKNVKLCRVQKESIAGALSTNTLSGYMSKLENNKEYLSEEEYQAAKNFALKIDTYYKKRDGFVPRKVINIINDNTEYK